MARKPPEELPLIAVIKEAVNNSGMSLTKLAEVCGVSQPQLSRFMAGQRTLTLNSAAKLFETLGLEVVKGKAGPRAGRLPGASEQPRSQPQRPKGRARS
jgi:transcriptional regulator with XRE-family HTH domain